MSAFWSFVLSSDFWLNGSLVDWSVVKLVDKERPLFGVMLPLMTQKQYFPIVERKLLQTYQSRVGVVNASLRHLRIRYGSEIPR